MDSSSCPTAPNTSGELFVGVALILLFGWLGYAMAGAMPTPTGAVSDELSAVHAER